MSVADSASAGKGIREEPAAAESATSPIQQNTFCSRQRKKPSFSNNKRAHRPTGTKQMTPMFVLTSIGHATMPSTAFRSNPPHPMDFTDHRESNSCGQLAGRVLRGRLSQNSSACRAAPHAPTAQETQNQSALKRASASSRLRASSMPKPPLPVRLRLLKKAPLPRASPRSLARARI